jgi:hypothetical protein
VPRPLSRSVCRYHKDPAGEGVLVLVVKHISSVYQLSPHEEFPRGLGREGPLSYNNVTLCIGAALGPTKASFFMQ